MYSLTRNYQSAHAIAHVLYENLVTSDKKMLKKYMRLRYICEHILAIPVEMFPVNIRYILSRPDIRISDFEYSSMIMSPSKLFDQTTTRYYRSMFVPNPVVVDIESKLTSFLCNGQDVYDVTTTMLMSFQAWIWSNSALREPLENGDIIMYFKGSMAHRTILLDIARSDEARAILNKHYPAAGDNDFEVLINPRLKNYQVVSHIVRSETHKFMSNSDIRAGLLARLSVCKSVKRLKKGKCFIKLNDTDYSVSESVRNDMLICSSWRGSSVTMYPVPCNIYYTFNDKLTFTNALNQTAVFDLHRFKYAMRVGQKTFGSELIDICIPHACDYKVMSLDFTLFNNALIRL